MRAYYVVPLIARGRTLGAIAALQAESGRDFTDEDCATIDELGRRAALALDNARLYAEAEAARREAERANRAKDEFLGILGHELRNPLAPIVMALDVMERIGAGDSAAQRRIIERQVRHLLAARRRPARRLAHHARQDRSCGASASTCATSSPRRWS